MSDKSTRALALHDQLFNCAQSVLGAFCEEYGLPFEQAMRAAGGLGGGLRSGEVCGAVSGAVMVIGLKFGQTAPNDKAAKEQCGKITMEFVDRFRARQGALRCVDLLGYDIRDAEAKARNPERAKQVCPPAIETAVLLLEEMGF